ncbi:hypothetical protein RFI_11906 [Reticulomyxa filosa]|uniref:Uncharacterized protein n=1 Tax=Reticulomyxa filosa TaxID=46433 RepID=X6NHK1_RETFI|nr:hypothetical protein RFI_11906 [Reticulomyxa filosa]|eukprot:ETO25229.1 hypothetical protein RFI_11906 [Reticulomyxa filosa]
MATKAEDKAGAEAVDEDEDEDMTKGGKRQKFEEKNEVKVYFPNFKSEYFDTHVHLDMILQRLYRKDEFMLQNPMDRLPQFMQDNFKGNFGGCITISCDMGQSEYICYILDKFDNDNNKDKNKENETKEEKKKDKGTRKGKIYGAFGIHPHNAKDWNEQVSKRLEENLKKYKEKKQCVALGECGLDYFVKPGLSELLSPKHLQQPAFEAQLRMALQLALPLIIHTRQAEDDTFQILIHVHCFTDSLAFALNVLKTFPLSFFGFTGVITFASSSSHFQELIHNIPLDRILLETDGPFMAPNPFRGAISHSGYIGLVAEKIAEIKQIDVDVVVKQCRENTKKMYGV